MKITKSQLKRIIKEELHGTLREGLLDGPTITGPPGAPRDGQNPEDLLRGPTVTTPSPSDQGKEDMANIVKELEGLIMKIKKAMK